MLLIPQAFTLLRLLIAILVMIAHPVMLVVAQPYKERSTAFFATCTSLALACTLLAALLGDRELANESAATRFFESVDHAGEALASCLETEQVGLAGRGAMWK